jgi:hypothetical protein
LQSRFYRVLVKWTVVLFLALETLGLVVSVLGLVLKSAYGNAAYGNSWGQISLELALRIAIVVFLLFAYVALRKVSLLPLTITQQSALLTTRAVQRILIAVIALYALEAEKLAALGNAMPPFPSWSLGIFALGTVASTVILRTRFLRSANEQLRRDPLDTTALTQWRKITTTSLVLAMSVGFYGFFWRFMGDSQFVEWLFLVSSLGLLLLWRPRLDNPTSSPARSVLVSE